MNILYPTDSIGAYINFDNTRKAVNMKSEDYGLKFLKKKMSDGTFILFINLISDAPTKNSVLFFIDRLDKHDILGFIDDLKECMDGQTNNDEGFFSDSVEHMDILYQYPDVNINEALLIPMVDLIKILEEWLQFIS